MKTRHIIIVLFIFFFSCKEQSEQKTFEKKVDSIEQKGDFSKQQAEDLANLLKAGSIDEINSEIVEEITFGEGYMSTKTEKNGYAIFEYKLTHGILSCDVEFKTSDKKLEITRKKDSDSLKITLKTELCFSKIQIRPSSEQKVIKPTLIKTDKMSMHVFEIDLTGLPDKEYKIELLKEKEKNIKTIPITILTGK